MAWISFCIGNWRWQTAEIQSGSDDKDSTCNAGDLGLIPWDDPLEEGMATHSVFFPGDSPRTEEPGRLQSTGSQRAGHTSVTEGSSTVSTALWGQTRPKHPRLEQRKLYCRAPQRDGGSFLTNTKVGLTWWLRGKEFTCQYRRHVFDPWSRKIPHARRQLSLCPKTTEPVP